MNTLALPNTVVLLWQHDLGSDIERREVRLGQVPSRELLSHLDPLTAGFYRADSPEQLLQLAISRVNTRRRGWAEVRDSEDRVLCGWPRRAERRYPETPGLPAPDLRPRLTAADLQRRAESRERQAEAERRLRQADREAKRRAQWSPKFRAYHHALHCRRVSVGVKVSALTDEVMDWVIDRYREFTGIHPSDCKCEGR